MMALALDHDMTALRRLDESLHEAEDWLWRWGRIARLDKPPCDWPTANPIWRAMRQQLEGAAQSTAPVVEPEWFYQLDAHMAARLKPIERSYARRRWALAEPPEFARKRLGMSRSKADRVCHHVRVIVSQWVAIGA